MNYSTYRFELDLQKHQSQMSIAAFQYDTAKKLDIGLTDGGIPYDLPDGTMAVLVLKNLATETDMVHECNIVDGTRILYEFNEATAFETGTIECQIRLYFDGEEKLAGPKFLLVVAERVGAVDIIDENPGLDKKFEALDKAEAAEQDRRVAEGKRSEEEAKRVAAEEERASAEALREEREAERLTAEMERVRAETKREEAYEGKVDKTTEAYKVYGTDSKGQAVFDWSYEANGNTIARRLLNGHISVPLKPTEGKNATSKEYVDGLVNPLTEKQAEIEKKVADLESLTLTYTEETSTDYEKVVPAEVGKYALVKMIGSATEKIYGANSFNPSSFDLFTSDYYPIPYTVNDDGSITFTLRYDEGHLMGRSEITLHDGEYQIFIEGNGNIYHYINQVDSNAVRVEIEFLLPEGEEYGDQWYADEYEYTVKIMVTKISSAEGFISVTEAPAGTVFEPYTEPYSVSSAVERIESLGKNRLPSDVYDASKWVKEAGQSYSSYPLEFLSEGWYCASLKTREGYYFYLQKSTDGGKTYFSIDVGYGGTGYLNAGYLSTNNGAYQTPLWFKVDKKAGIVYRFIFYSISQSKLDAFYDIQIEKVNLAQEPSPSYLPSAYAPATAYSPYKAEPIDTIVIPEAVRSLDGYGREGSTIEWVIIEKGEEIITEEGEKIIAEEDREIIILTVTKDENLNPLPSPAVRNITNYFTEDNAIEVEGHGVLRFVNERNLAVPNTVGYVTRKG